MKSIPLTGRGLGLKAIVDDEDYEALSVYTWYLDSTGYPRRTYTSDKVRTIRMHTQILGKVPRKMATDHINRDKLDNRRANLRVVPWQINCVNKSMQSNNTSGITGVSYDKRRDNWVVQMQRKGVCIYRRRFINLSDAIVARQLLNRKFGV